MYPSIEIWSLFGIDDLDRQGSYPITLTPNNFTTSGVYRYTFSSPIFFSNKYKLGLYQPSDERSVVRVYRIPGPTLVGRVHNNALTGTRIDIVGSIIEVDWIPFNALIHPVTSPSS